MKTKKILKNEELKDFQEWCRNLDTITKDTLFFGSTTYSEYYLNKDKKQEDIFFWSKNNENNKK